MRPGSRIRLYALLVRPPHDLIVEVMNSDASFLFQVTVDKAGLLKVVQMEISSGSSLTALDVAEWGAASKLLMVSCEFKV